MAEIHIKEKDYGITSLKSKLPIIQALVFGLPGIVVAYLYYEKHIVLDIYQMIISGAALALILGGLVTLRQVSTEYIW